MAVDYVLLHIVIALGVMALAAHTANADPRRPSFRSFP